MGQVVLNFWSVAWRLSERCSDRVGGGGDVSLKNTFYKCTKDFFLIDYIGFNIQIQTFDILNLDGTKYGLHLKTNLLSVDCIFFIY